MENKKITLNAEKRKVIADQFQAHYENKKKQKLIDAKNQYDLMRAPHQEGSFNTSVKYGYLNVGKVIKGPRKYENKMVYTMYPHQSKFIINLSVVTLTTAFTEAVFLAASRRLAVPITFVL